MFIYFLCSLILCYHWWQASTRLWKTPTPSVQLQKELCLFVFPQPNQPLQTATSLCVGLIFLSRSYRPGCFGSLIASIMMSCGCLGCRGDHCCGFPPLQSLLKSKAQQEPKSGEDPTISSWALPAGPGLAHTLVHCHNKYLIIFNVVALGLGSVSVIIHSNSWMWLAGLMDVWKHMLRLWSVAGNVPLRFDSLKLQKWLIKTG